MASLDWKYAVFWGRDSIGYGDSVDLCISKALSKRPVSVLSAIAFTRQLPGNAARHFRDAPETAHGVVSGRDIRPAKMENIELAITSNALGLDVHTLEQIRIAFGIEDNYRLEFIDAGDALDPSNALGDEQLGQTRLAYTGRDNANDQGADDRLLHTTTCF